MKLNNTTLKTFKIIELLSKNIDGLTLSEISSYLNIPTSTTHDILNTLVSIDVLVIKNFKLKTYSIGPKMYIYGSTYTKSSNLLNYASKYLKELADKYDLTSFIYKNNNSPVIVYKYQSPNAKVLTKEVGDILSIDNSAAGIIYKSFSNDNVSKEAMVYMDLGKSESHKASIACAVFDKQNSLNLSGVIGVTLINDNKIDYEQISLELKEISNKITSHLMSVE